jgi:hypothetical protein
MKLSLWKAGSTAPRPDLEAAARVKGWTRAILHLDEDATIAANEIVCADPACPGSETVILVMVPGARTKAYKVQAEMRHVTEEALRAALAG